MRKLLPFALVTLALAPPLGLTLLAGAVTARTPGQFFDSNGVQIHYTDEGQGVPVILIHGLGINADLNWRVPGFVDKLAKTYRVITLDARGHGLSGKPHEAAQYGVEMAEDVVRLMDHLGIEKAHVAGYSMGGFITLKLLTLHPERLLSAAPCAAGFDTTTPENLELMEELVAALHAGDGVGPLTRRLEPGGNPSGFKVRAINMAMRYLNDLDALAAVIEGFPEFQVEAGALQANTVPVLSICGSKDPLRTGVDNMIGRTAQHEVLFIEGRDHATTIIDRQFIEGLMAFLAKHTPAPGAA